MCAEGEDKITKNEIFNKQFEFAWEHFRFHAEQRTRMFHFFLITAALLLNAFSFLIDARSYEDYAFLVLCIGGLVSTMFLSLDVRNVQLLRMSEELLQRIEEEWLYPASDSTWRAGNTGDEIKLGMLSREDILRTYLKKAYSDDYRSWKNLIRFNNIKHRFSIRFIQLLAIVLFWISALFATPSESWWAKGLEILCFLVCIWWAVHAMRTPKRHRGWEPRALEWFDNKPNP